MTDSARGEAHDVVRAHLAESARVKEQVASACADDIVTAAARIATAFRSGGKLLLCGNGGSAADCQHIAAEFVSVLDHRKGTRRAFPAVALTTDTSFLTANANDFGFENVFARQLEALGRRGDALLAITTSGNSANVLRALRHARDAGLATIVLTGRTGGKATELGDVVVRVPSDSTQHIQESHIAIGHLLCELVERSMLTEGR